MNGPLHVFFIHISRTPTQAEEPTVRSQKEPTRGQPPKIFSQMKKPEVIQAFGTKKQGATQLQQQILPTGFQVPSMPASFTSGPLKGWLIQLAFKLAQVQVNLCSS